MMGEGGRGVFGREEGRAPSDMKISLSLTFHPDTEQGKGGGRV